MSDKMTQGQMKALIEGQIARDLARSDRDFIEVARSARSVEVRAASKLAYIGAALRDPESFYVFDEEGVTIEEEEPSEELPLIAEMLLDHNTLLGIDERLEVFSEGPLMNIAAGATPGDDETEPDHSVRSINLKGLPDPAGGS